MRSRGPKLAPGFFLTSSTENCTFEASQLSMSSSSSTNLLKDAASESKENQIAIKSVPSLENKDEVEGLAIEDDGGNLVARIELNATEVDLTRVRLQRIQHFETLTKLQELSLRWNLLKKIENLSGLCATLTHVDLYDNQITKIENLDKLVNLEHLDVSFNRIERLENLDLLVKLKRLYVTQNRLKAIENLDGLVNLELLELGGNQITKIENLDKLSNIKKLYLGANKIRVIANLDALTNLVTLSLPCNRIRRIEGLAALTNLIELQLGDNGIQTIENLEHNLQLQIIDLSQNRLKSVGNVKHLQELTDVWVQRNEIDNWEWMKELSQLPKLTTVFMSSNPIQRDDDPTYRRRMILGLPIMTCLDAIPCRLEKK